MSESNDRRARDRWIGPLVNEPFIESCYCIANDAALRELRATVRAMRTVTNTNCGWTTFDAARAFMPMIEREIRVRENKRRRKAPK